MKTSAIHINAATILPDTAEELSKAHQQHGSRYVSATVMGVPSVAYVGELTTLCSGDSAAISECEAIINTFSQSIVNLGEQAKAAPVMKICMNYSLVTTMELISELYAFAEKSGLALEHLQTALHHIYGHPAFKRYIDKIKNRDFDTVNFDMTGGRKDVSIFQQAFNDQGVVPRLADVVKGRFISAFANGMQDKDWSAIYEIVRMESGLE